jgi:hypothetical protein
MASVATKRSHHRRNLVPRKIASISDGSPTEVMQKTRLPKVDHIHPCKMDGIYRSAKVLLLHLLPVHTFE